VDQRTKYDEAIRAYEAVLARDPADVRTMLKVSDLLLRAERHAEAVAAYERAAKHYEAEGFFLKARAICAQIIAIVRAHEELAGKLDGAQAWEVALMAKLGSSHAPPLPHVLAGLRREADVPELSLGELAELRELGAVYRQQGLYAEAIAAFAMASRDPAHEHACYRAIGMIHREQGNTDDAIGAFLRALQARVTTPAEEVALVYEIGDAYAELGRSAQARHYFERVARLSPTYADPRGTVAQRLAALRRR
jgi:tetratricopeptide (TPR) repeat protein